MNVYADNAATTRMSQAAVDAMLPFLRESYGNPSSLYTLGQKAAESLQASRETMAKYLGCDAREITFTSGGSEADNQALLTAATLGSRKGKKHIISTAFEHHAILHSLKRLEKQGFEVTDLLDVHENGLVTAQQVADGHPRGYLPRDGHVCKQRDRHDPADCRRSAPSASERGVLFHTDAVQAAGHLPIDVQRAEHRHAFPFRPTSSTARRASALLYVAQGHFPDELHRGRRAGARQARRHRERRPASSAWLRPSARPASTMDENIAKVTALRDKLIDGPVENSALRAQRRPRASPARQRELLL